MAICQIDAHLDLIGAMIQQPPHLFADAARAAMQQVFAQKILIGLEPLPINLERTARNTVGAPPGRCAEIRRVVLIILDGIQAQDQ